MAYRKRSYCSNCYAYVETADRCAAKAEWFRSGVNELYDHEHQTFECLDYDPKVADTYTFMINGRGLYAYRLEMFKGTCSAHNSKVAIRL